METGVVMDPLGVMWKVLKRMAEAQIFMVGSTGEREKTLPGLLWKRCTFLIAFFKTLL
jgi:hypothetical protein